MTMKYLDTFVRWLLAILMFAVTCLTFYQIIMRFVFNNASSWSEEATRFLFVWASFIAAGIGIKEHIHIGIDAVVNMLPANIRKGIEILVYAGIGCFGGWLSYSCIGLMEKTAKQLSPALKYPKSWIYAAVFAFGVLCIICAAYEIINKFKLREGEEQ